MKKLLGLLLVLGMAVSARAADISNTNADMRKLNNRLDNAAHTLEQIQGIKEKGVPKWIASKADCIAVVPGLFKGAFIIGAEYGQGVVSCRTKHGWSGPVFIRLAGGSFGFQAGGSGTDLVLVATNEKGMQDLMQTKLKLGGTAAGAAGPIGRQAQAATNLTFKSELLTYSRSHGLFAGVDLSGVTVMNNEDDTVALYNGQYHNFQHILDGEVPPPNNASARRFMRVLDEYFGAATQRQEERRTENPEH